MGLGSGGHSWPGLFFPCTGACVRHVPSRVGLQEETGGGSGGVAAIRCRVHPGAWMRERDLEPSNRGSQSGCPLATMDGLC